MATLTVAAFLDALRTQLVARGGLSGVTVSTGPLGGDVGTEVIQFGDVSLDDEYLAMGRRLHTYVVEGDVFIRRAGAGEAVIKAARDRAIALMEELRDEITEGVTVGASVLIAEFRSLAMSQQVTDPPARTCSIRFTLEVKDDS